MVRMFLVIIFIAMLPSESFAAATFSAKTDKESISIGEGFNLEIKLSGTRAESSPDITKIKSLFNVVGTQESSSVTVINGEKSQSSTWIYTLSAKTQGDIKIPPISIATEDGEMSTNEIALKASKAPNNINKSGGQMRIVSEISKKSPYVNEALVYTIRVFGEAETINNNLNIPDAENILTEPLSEPKTYEELRDGKVQKITEIKHLMIPLKSGTLEIPPATLSGRIKSGDSRDNINPDLMQGLGFNMIIGGDDYESFSIGSEAIKIDVKPPPVAMNPWLPLSSLVISESWNDKVKFSVGEPFKRTISLNSKGAGGKLLPPISLGQIEGIKAYEDKPDIGEIKSPENGVVTGWRTESFTIVPTKPGKVIMPAIKIAWWDIKKDKISYAELPARILNISGTAKSVPLSKTKKDSLQKAPEESAQEDISYEIYVAVISVAMLSLYIGLFLYTKRNVLWSYARKNEVILENKEPAFRPNKKEKEKKLKPLRPDLRTLDKLNDAQAIASFIREYAHFHFSIAKNTSLKKIAEDLGLSEKNSAFVELDSALYKGQEVDLGVIKKGLRDGFLGAKKAKKYKSHNSLPPINPN